MNQSLLAALVFLQIWLAGPAAAITLYDLDFGTDPSSQPIPVGSDALPRDTVSEVIFGTPRILQPSGTTSPGLRLTTGSGMQAVGLDLTPAGLQIDDTIKNIEIDFDLFIGQVDPESDGSGIRLVIFLDGVLPDGSIAFGNRGIRFQDNGEMGFHAGCCWNPHGTIEQGQIHMGIDIDFVESTWSYEIAGVTQGSQTLSGGFGRLRFSASGGPGQFVIDNVLIRATVPEPNTALLFSMGLATFARSRRVGILG